MTEGKARWHINEKGRERECTAPQGECPIMGKDEDHFDTPEQARAFFEVKMRRDQAKTKLTNKKYVGNGPSLDLENFPYGDYVAPDGTLWKYESASFKHPNGEESRDVRGIMVCVAGKDAGTKRNISQEDALKYRLLVSRHEIEANLAEINSMEAEERRGLPEDEMAEGFTRSRKRMNEGLLEKAECLEGNGATLAIGKKVAMNNCVMLRGTASTLPESLKNHPNYRGNSKYKEDVVVFIPNIQRLSKSRALKLGEMIYVLEGNSRKSWNDYSDEAKIKYVTPRLKKFDAPVSIDSRDGDALINYTGGSSTGALRAASTYIVESE